MSFYCPTRTAAASAFAAYAALGAIAMVMQCVACSLLCRVRSRWVDDAASEAARDSHAPQQHQQYHRDMSTGAPAAPFVAALGGGGGSSRSTGGSSSAPPPPKQFVV